ncbi:microspherule protein 1-like [Ptychodera flava]|uniref:microspherule protein 1-like n=1 Tax=Ptychodera flava TaxID=63121 RepID=UPI00396A3D5D
MADLSMKTAATAGTTVNPSMAISAVRTSASSSGSSSHVLSPAGTSTSHKPKLPPPIRPPPSRPGGVDVTPRRSSSRSIKRKKFDDELVESSLIKSNRGRLPVPPTEGIGQTETQQPEKKKPSSKSSSSSSAKRAKKQKLPPAIKDLGRWKPQDDLALITAVQQTNDLKAVHTGVKFSCRFTLNEIEERWYALLYDPAISKIGQQAMKNLHPDVKQSVLNKALFSKEEETLIGTVSSTSQPNQDTFQELLNKHPTVFHPSRTDKSLFSHWLLMKQYHLLPDQSVQPMPRGDHVLNFSDTEDMIDDSQLQDPRDEVIEHELSVADRRQKREIRHLENEIPKWQVLVDSVTGISPPDFDSQTLAVLRGRLVRYLMRSREITLGRATKDNNIDVDLSLEGPAWKISRRQGVIKLRNNGDFFIANEGKRPIYIDGKPVSKGEKAKLNNNSVVEITGLRFIFLINQDLIGIIRTEAAKMGVQ